MKYSEWKQMPAARTEDDDEFLDRINSMTSFLVPRLCADCGFTHEMNWCPKCSSETYVFINDMIKRPADAIHKQ